jgi:hypothetical protein
MATGEGGRKIMEMSYRLRKRRKGRRHALNPTLLFSDGRDAEPAI